MLLLGLVACGRGAGCGCCSEYAFCDGNIGKSCTTDWPAHFLKGSNSNNPLAVIPGLFYTERQITVAADCDADSAKQGFPRVCALLLADNDTKNPFPGCIDKDAVVCTSRSTCSANNEILNCIRTTRGFVSSREYTFPCPANTACHPSDTVQALCEPLPWVACAPDGGYPVCRDPATLISCYGTRDAGYIEHVTTCSRPDAGADADAACYPAGGSHTQAHCGH